MLKYLPAVRRQGALLIMTHCTIPRTRVGGEYIAATEQLANAYQV